MQQLRFFEVLGHHIVFSLLGRVTSFRVLQFVGHMLLLLLFVIKVGARLRHLLEQLDLMIFLDPAQLPQLLQFTRQTVDHLHAFEKLRTAVLIATVLLTLRRIELVRQVGKLVLKACDVSLLGSQLHDFLPQFVQESVLVALGHGCCAC